MIFRQWEKVLDGTKTQTRRLVKKNDYAVNANGCILPNPEYGDQEIAAVYDKNGRSRWQAWDLTTRAVQPGRGKKSVGRIRIAEIRRERVQDISETDAIAEGIYRHSELAGWTFTYQGKQGPHFFGLAKWAFRDLWDSIYKKAPHRWEDNPEVWVLSFILVEAQNGAHN